MLERFHALDERRILVLAADGAAEILNGEPGVGQGAGGGDDAQVLLVGAAAGRAEALQRRLADLRGLGQLRPRADVISQRLCGNDAPPDLVLFEHGPQTVRGQNRTGLDSKDRPG